MQKNKKLTEAQLKKAFKKFRTEIDSADRMILNSFARRFKDVNQVGKIKHALDLPIYQKARWDEVVLDRVKMAKRAKVDEAFTRALLKLIHKEAIRIQKTRQT